MRNNYRIDGETTTIFLNSRRGACLTETVIDTADLPKVTQFVGSWYAHKHIRDELVYVRIHTSTEEGHKTIALHRLIAEAPKHLQVDHINHNTLDNRRSNLRLVTASQNKQNLNGAQRNNKSSGIRGVYWHKANNVWTAAIEMKGKKIHLGCFSDLEVAAKVVSDARATLMPYSEDARIKV